MTDFQTFPLFWHYVMLYSLIAFLIISPHDFLDFPLLLCSGSGHCIALLKESIFLHKIISYKLPFWKTLVVISVTFLISYNCSVLILSLLDTPHDLRTSIYTDVIFLLSTSIIHYALYPYNSIVFTITLEIFQLIFLIQVFPVNAIIFCLVFLLLFESGFDSLLSFH